ncbi:MAG: phosphoglucosamine mutase [Candidatus Omnitrophica bacterium]|nr:phosphoglucosamine mutase [Candidatus Omnitrophota bacterium]
MSAELPADLKMGVSGVRGIVGPSFGPEQAVYLAQCFGEIMGRGRIALGRDTRTTGVVFRDAVQAGLLAAGCEVVDIGICPTPTVLLAVRSEDYVGGIVITASHNPPEWNGLKFVGGGGRFLTAPQAERLYEMYHRRRAQMVPWDHIKATRSKKGALEQHIAKILEAVDVEAIRAAKFKVGLDCCNGAGSLVSADLLKQLGCQIKVIHDVPNGLFPRGAEPKPENLQALGELVRTQGLDIGFAQDPDADRLGLVIDGGTPISEEITLALGVEGILIQSPGSVVINLSTSKAIEDIAAGYGVEIFRTPVGEANVVDRMIQESAVVGGEGNGGIILGRINYGRDSLVGMALILQYMALTGKKVSELVEALPQYAMIKASVQCGQNVMTRVLNVLAGEYGDHIDDQSDGLRVVLANGTWFHVRGSNTEPVMRILVESKDGDEAGELCDHLKARIEEAGHKQAGAG